ncbi:hypothetical protein BH10ACT8_BH10ACT8_22810 [soil metagenome]
MALSSQRSAANRREPGDHDPESLLSVAVRLCAVNGFRQTSLHDIAIETGLTIQQVVRAIPTKDELLVLTLDPLLDALDELFARVESEPAARSADTAQLLSETVRGVVELFVTQRDRAAVLLRVEDDGTEVSAHAVRRRQSCDSALTVLTARVQDITASSEQAPLSLAQLLGMVDTFLQWQTGGSQGYAQRAVDVVTGLALDGLLPKAADAGLALIESERRFRTAFDASPVGIALSDERGLFVAANRALCGLLGRTESELLGHSSAEFTHPDDLESQARAEQLLSAADDGVVRLEKRYLRPNGELRWAWLTVTMTAGPADRTWTLAHVQDVTERKKAELALQESEANLTAVAAVVRRIQGGEDAKTTIVDAAKALSRASYVSLLEPEPEGGLRVVASTDRDLLGRWVSLKEPSATASVYLSGQRLLLSDPHNHPGISPTLLQLTQSESVALIPVLVGDQVSGVLSIGWEDRVFDFGERAMHALLMLADEAGLAFKQERLMRELERLATTDELTGLPNRRGWDLRLDQLMAVARRTGSALTVALADLDNFKSYNDRFGHHAGDSLLRGFSSGARTAIREVDHVARWGGEEFAVALPDCDADEAVAVLNRIRLTVPGEQTCSVGYATWDGMESPLELIERADQALYLAKAAGRNMVWDSRLPAQTVTEAG